METMYGCKGSELFIMDVTNKQVYAFNNFGCLSNTKGLISSCNNWQKVDVISLVGEGNTCELLFDGFKCKLNSSIMSNVAKLRKTSGYIGTVLMISHEDEFGKYNQILFVYKKGIMSKEKVSQILGCSGWITL